MKKRNLLLIMIVLTLGALIYLFKAPLASSQGVTMVAVEVSGDLPENDFASPLWDDSTAVAIPLSAQAVSRPILRETRVKSVTARALHNGTRIAFLVEWEDATKNEQMLRVQDFRDAVAMQFPQVTGQPFYCMGMQGGNVNIWHWKADWQADLLAWQDMESAYPEMNVDQYPFAEGEMPAPQDYQDVNYVPATAAGNLFAAPHISPVEDLVAGGFGTLTTEPAEGQNVQGYGEWASGKWRVIFSRDLVSSEADDTSFTPGAVYSVAFAAWDGDNAERNGQKSTSQWISLQLEGKPGARAAGAEAAGLPRNTVMLIVLGALVVLIAAGSLIYVRLPN